MNSKIKTILLKLISLIPVLIFILVLFFLNEVLKKYSLNEIILATKNISLNQIYLASALTFISYLILGFYDLLGFIYIKKSLNFVQVFLTSFMAFAFSNSIGMAGLAGNSLRLRTYTSFGVSPGDILKIISIVTVSFWLGFLTLAGISLCIHPIYIPYLKYFNEVILRGLGAFFLIIVSFYLILPFFTKKSFRLGTLEFEIPNFKLSLAQILVATLDWSIAALILFVLLPGPSTITFPIFIGIFVTSNVIALLTHVPGGIGILEFMVIYFISPDHHPHPQILASLILFRVIYYFAPLLLGILGLSTFEFLKKRFIFKKIGKSIFEIIRPLIPTVMAVVVFLSGIILLISGVTPSDSTRFASFASFASFDQFEIILPLPLVEVSHFLSSIFGVILLILARGLKKRNNAAWFLTLIFMSFGALFTFLKGYDYEEATILLLFIILLYNSKNEFFRKASITTDALSKRSFIAIFMVLITVGWLGFFSYKHVEYNHYLWWTFSLDSDASRFLRLLVAASIILALLGLRILLKPKLLMKNEVVNYDEKELVPAIKLSNYTYTNLALLGDKYILYSNNKKAALMYSYQGNSLISMGDPFGEVEEFPDLIFKFLELSDKYEMDPVFYQIHPDNIPLYLEHGFKFIKLGEEAQVEIQKFTIEGGDKKGIRHSYNRFNKENYNFSIISSDKFEDIKDELKIISDTWLNSKDVKEKGFSIGFYDESYLSKFPIALVKNNEKILAFANVWVTENKNELSLDLMRHLDEVPHGVMEYLFIELILWGKNEGYKWFNLGMAPLSGLEANKFTTKWSRLAKTIYNHGERFYNFKGLKNYKEKFQPVWIPRYLAYKRNLTLIKNLADVTFLISGGIKGVFSK